MVWDLSLSLSVVFGLIHVFSELCSLYFGIPEHCSQSCGLIYYNLALYSILILLGSLHHDNIMRANSSYILSSLHFDRFCRTMESTLAVVSSKMCENPVELNSFIF